MKHLIIGSLLTFLGGIALASDGVVVIMDDQRLRALCLIGSCLGAFLSVGLLPKVQDEFKQYAVKFGGAATVGILATPLVIRYLQLAPDSDWVLGVSGLVAMLSTVTLHKLIPFYEAWLDKKLDSVKDKE